MVRNSPPSAAAPSCSSAIRASENIDKSRATLVSCMTTPRFDYAGFRMIPRAELETLCPAQAAELGYLVLE